MTKDFEPVEHPTAFRGIINALDYVTIGAVSLRRR